VDVKAIATSQARLALRSFLDSKSILHLPRPATQRVSILLVLYNRAELTLACLRSLQPRLADVDAEVVLVDNASRDETALLLDRIRGARVIRNPDNRGFPHGVNQAAEAATGRLLLLLNNDTEVLGDSLASACRFAEAHDDVGAVGGRIILLDGNLQEAGCTVWREAHVLQYGRGDRPTAPQYLFQRDVDYCSGAFLLTRRELFWKMGGLDTAFSPGYFEDLDYCVRLWRSGWRVVYLPEVALLHYENASSESRKDVLQLYRRNHILFQHKHADWLAWQPSSDSTPEIWARSSHDDRFKILYLPKCDTQTRTPGRAGQIEHVVRRLCASHCFVTVYPIGEGAALAADETPGLPADVEVMPGGSLDTLSDFLSNRREFYDCLLASDPEIVARLKQIGSPFTIAA
jgi:O-antigen biosynthesis protein